jgi:preprotein translocase subunit SecB
VKCYLNTTKLLERKSKLGKMFFSQRPAQVNLHLTVLEVEEEDILYKVVVEAKVEKKKIQTGAIFKAEEPVKAEGIFKVEETVKAEGIFKEDEIVNS